MDFIFYAKNWIKGEITEAYIFGSAGLLIIIIAILFWQLGNAPYSKALVIPLLVIGLFYTIVGGTTVLLNQKRIPKFEKAYEINNNEFIQSEKKRVEDFRWMYKATIIVASIFFTTAIAFFVIGFFITTFKYDLRAIGIALVLFSLLNLTIDYFADERANIYYEKILNEIRQSDVNYDM